MTLIIFLIHNIIHIIIEIRKNMVGIQAYHLKYM
jgi:hypothetical protein